MEVRAAHTRLAEHIATGGRLLECRFDVAATVAITPGLMSVAPHSAHVTWEQRQAGSQAEGLPVRTPLVILAAGLLVLCDAGGARPLLCLRLRGATHDQQCLSAVAFHNRYALICSDIVS